MSSSTANLFAIVILAIAGAAGAAYALNNPGQLTDFVRTVFLPSPATESVARAGGRDAEDSDTPTHSAEAGSVSLKADDHGHFETEAEINGRPIDVMVDTGATIVALTYDDAERSGIYPKPGDFTHTVSTANGQARVAPVEIDSIRIGDITVRNIRAAVAEPGKLHRTLLGMSFLGRLSRVDMRSNTLVLHE